MFNKHDNTPKLPIKMGNASIAAQFKGGEDNEAWVNELRRKYPQQSDAPILKSYKDGFERG